MKCRHCGRTAAISFLDLGFAPPSNAYLRGDDLARMEATFPLRVKACAHCWLVQTEDYAAPEHLFDPEYAYFSSTSSGWLDHAARFAAMATDRFALGRDSLVIEVASNDGYLLRNFVAAGVPCLGIEPTAGTAEAAERIGIPVVRAFFGHSLARQLAESGKLADLIVANNVFAHVPDINDFTRGLAAALKPGGSLTLEFPHLLRLIGHGQFDTVYHEHFSYFSLHAARTILAAQGLFVYDVEELATHGGSLRVYAGHAAATHTPRDSVAAVLDAELKAGLLEAGTYSSFQSAADNAASDLMAFLIEQRRAGKLVAGYGAAAKGNTLLNHAGVKPNLLRFICDAAPSKQGKFMPGSHIPILPPAALRDADPDYVLILPWNIAEEAKSSVVANMSRRPVFVTAIPKLAFS